MELFCMLFRRCISNFTKTSLEQHSELFNIRSSILLTDPVGALPQQPHDADLLGVALVIAVVRTQEDLPNDERALRRREETLPVLHHKDVLPMHHEARREEVGVLADIGLKQVTKG